MAPCPLSTTYKRNQPASPWERLIVRDRFFHANTTLIRRFLMPNEFHIWACTIRMACGLLWTPPRSRWRVDMTQPTGARERYRCSFVASLTSLLKPTQAPIDGLHLWEGIFGRPLLNLSVSGNVTDTSIISRQKAWLSFRLSNASIAD